VTKGRKFDFSRLLRNKTSRRRPPKRPTGGSEAVPVEPNRPKLNEGGAAAPLEFDEPA
jgi:hypothetical protein